MKDKPSQYPYQIIKNLEKSSSDDQIKYHPSLQSQLYEKQLNYQKNKFNILKPQFN